MSVAFLFPGQGSQVPGMLHALPIIRPSATLDEVTEALGKTAGSSTRRRLFRSTVSGSTGVADFRCRGGTRSRRRRCHAGSGCRNVSGAFAAAGGRCVLNLADGVRLMKLRAERMVELYPQGHGLAAIVG